MKTAFIHIMKTAGSTVNYSMAKNVFKSKSYLLLNAGIYREPDWTEDELQDFLTWKTDRVFVHNHAFNWSTETIRQYIGQGWLTFSFYRHPGDQWCSYYYWAREDENVKRRRMRPGQSEPIAWKYSLDEFLQHGWSTETKDSVFPRAFRNIRKNLDLPECWREMGYVDIWSNENFTRFVSKYFETDDLQLAPHNQSENKGYDHYRQSGLIGEKTHQQLLNSNRYRDYQLLLQKPHESGSPLDYVSETPQPAKSIWANIPLLKRIGSKSSASGYVILADDGAATRRLSEYIRDHPDIQSFEDEFDRFDQTWGNQKKWLHNFYLRLPNRNREILAIGFKTSLGSISNLDRFREFLEKHQIKILHLSTPDPIRAAIADLCATKDNASAAETAMTQSQLNESETPFQLSRELFHKLMQRLKQRQSLNDYIATVDVPKFGLDYETLMVNEAVLLNRLWLFLGIGTARDNFKNLAERPTYPQGTIANLQELRNEFPEYESYF